MVPRRPCQNRPRLLLVGSLAGVVLLLALFIRPDPLDVLAVPGVAGQRGPSSSQDRIPAEEERARQRRRAAPERAESTGARRPAEVAPPPTPDERRSDTGADEPSPTLEDHIDRIDALLYDGTLDPARSAYLQELQDMLLDHQERVSEPSRPVR